MPKVKAVSGAAKKTSVKRTRKAKARKAEGPETAPKPRAPRRSATSVSRKTAPAPPAPEPFVPVHPEVADAQSQVVASKFATADTAPAKPASRPTLPVSYGESHLLLLVRDPQTLFAAWDMSPSTVEALKTRLGRRGFAVSTLTLRLTRAGGGATIFHLGKKARSRYLKIDGGPSFIAEIGYTTPAGRFELVARSTPCFVPMGPAARQEAQDAGRRAVLGYREAVAAARRGAVSPNPVSGAARAKPGSVGDGAASSLATPAPRILGGASDLYRR